ncbi:hypothetical protein [Streptomyces hydrogenans]|uniref:hypothetical protein n=1 Tax=Streptomyces hydrogenans TaxID=1873719 RepID=UPI0034444B3D
MEQITGRVRDVVAEHGGDIDATRDLVSAATGATLNAPGRGILKYPTTGATGKRFMERAAAADS